MDLFWPIRIKHLLPVDHVTRDPADGENNKNQMQWMSHVTKIICPNQIRGGGSGIDISGANVYEILWQCGNCDQKPGCPQIWSDSDEWSVNAPWKTMEQDQNKPLTQLTQWDYQYDQNIDDMHRKDAFSVIFPIKSC